MAIRVVQTSRRLAAERQIHAAIKHFREGDFECVITLCSAAEGQMPEPEPNAPIHFFARLKHHSAKNPAPDGRKDDFNYDANWMKHCYGANEVEIDELMVKLWLYRAITKYYAVYGIGTPEMAALFPWAGEARVAVGNASPPHAA
jgi:hypothetical protein